MDDYVHDVGAALDPENDGKSEYPPAWSLNLFYDRKHGIPKLVLSLTSLLVFIFIEVGGVSYECDNVVDDEPIEEDGSVTGYSFVAGMLLGLFFLELIWLAFYFLIGLRRLTKLGSIRQLSTGETQVSYLSWWMIELSTHFCFFVLLALAIIIATIGISTVEPDSPTNCEESGKGFYEFTLALGYFVLIALGVMMYIQFTWLKNEHGVPPIPCKKKPVEETVHAV